MNKGAWVITTLAVGAAAAFGWGSLVASYPDPPGFPMGLGYSSYFGSKSICMTTQLPAYMWRLDPLTGSITGSFSPPANNPFTCDAGAIISNYVWVGAGPSFIYRQGYYTGSVYGSWAAPPHVAVEGLAFRRDVTAKYIVLTGYTASSPITFKLYRCDIDTGSVYASYPLAFLPGDIAHDGDRYCYWVSDTNNKRIRQINYQGQSIADFSVPFYPKALAYEPGRNYVWVSDWEHYDICVYETGGSPVSSGIAPNSLGRIKATFR